MSDIDQEVQNELDDEAIARAFASNVIDHIEGKAIVKTADMPKPVDRARQHFSFNKPAAIAQAKAEGKRGARVQFQDHTQHAILLNGQHVRIAPKARGKAERKAIKRSRRLARLEPVTA